MIVIQDASINDFNNIVEQINKLELDTRELNYNQFLAAKINNQLVGFGRIKHYENCSELCSLGVICDMQNNGIGKKLTQALIFKATLPLFIVTVIPKYFKPFGFRVVNTFDINIQNKLNYCNKNLAVDEPYKVMLLKEYICNKK